MVEGAHQLRGHLQVLQLVGADGHVRAAVDEHVGGLQHRVEQQAERHLAHGGRLLPVLRQVLQARLRGQAGQQPAQLGVPRHGRLREEHAPRGVEPRRQQHGGQLQRALVQRRAGLPGAGERVQVGHEHHHVVAALLRAHAAPQRAEVVAHVQRARRLQPRDDAARPLALARLRRPLGAPHSRSFM